MIISGKTPTIMTCLLRETYFNFQDRMKLATFRQDLNKRMEVIQDIENGLIEKHRKNAIEGMDTSLGISNQMIKPEHLDEFVKDFSEFDKQEYEFDFTPVTITEKSKLTAEQIYLLLEMGIIQYATPANDKK